MPEPTDQPPNPGSTPLPRRDKGATQRPKPMATTKKPKPAQGDR